MPLSTGEKYDQSEMRNKELRGDSDGARNLSREERKIMVIVRQIEEMEHKEQTVKTGASSSKLESSGGYGNEKVGAKRCFRNAFDTGVGMKVATKGLRGEGGGAGGEKLENKRTKEDKHKQGGLHGKGGKEDSVKKSSLKEGLKTLLSTLLWDLRNEADRDNELTPGLCKRMDQLEKRLLAKYCTQEPGWYSEKLQYKQAFQGLVSEVVGARKHIRDGTSVLCKGLSDGRAGGKSVRKKRRPVCQHNRQRNECKQCGWASICEHNRRRNRCKLCGGASICEHNRERYRCIPCGGSGICEHNRQKNRCKQCGGSSICEHNRVRSTCKQCGQKSLVSMG